MRIEKLDSKIVALNGRKYKVYLKRVNAKRSKEGSNGLMEKAFVKRIG